MPSTVAANATSGSRFKLPALNLNFGSITDGTDIPPPPDSPVEKEKPVLPETPKKKAVPETGAKTEEDKTVKKPEETPKATNEGHLASNGGVAASIDGSRPASRSGNSILDERKSKRASGWFKRLRGGESKRSSLVLSQESTASTTTIPVTNKPSGPPPPMIPELKEFNKDEGSLGNDLFKNIK
ncbi:unnamed protein product [Clonostachys rosea f. rosea IK726]|uniref:Uncharacterized protein n=2 Tax=Bionectria ochroleuca TaxID=29856 RepID=A0A0B7K8Q6_BIOOC|nr:unnamed protein product [Clonostachys rosea f. rosea IK726]